MRRRAGSALALVAVAALVAGCAGGLSDDGEALTPEQAEQLANARFQLSTLDSFVAEIEVGADDDLDRLAARVTVDPAEHLAWGTLSRGPEKIAVDTEIIMSAELFATGGDGAWQPQQWSGAAASLPIVFSLTTDRPENASLLRQSDARFLGTEDELDVFRLPTDAGDGSATARLWLDGSRIERLDTTTGALSVEIDREAEPAPRPEAVDELAP